MPVSDYSLRLAKKQVDEYTNIDAAMAQHYVVMGECEACEQFLSSGITAFDWLKRADDTLREAARQGLDVDEEAKKALELLYRQWLHPCSKAEQRIQEQKSKGYTPENLEEFRKAQAFIKRQVRLLDMDAGLEATFDGAVFDARFWEDANDIPAS